MKTRFLIIVAIALTLSACATPTPQQNPAVVKARTAIAAAANNPAVSEYAPITLQKAQEALDKAESAVSADWASHYAYIAMGRARIAKAKAAEGRANEIVAQAQEKRRQILANARREELRSREQALESQNEQIKELKAKLSELNPRKTDEGIVLTLGSVLFAFDSAELRPGAATTLNHLADFLNGHPQDRVKIIGYTDSIGSSTYNMQLSKERALSVRSALVQRGISATSMVATGRGENNPVATNQTKAGRQRNRRVEFIILTGQKNRRSDQAAADIQ